MSLTNPFGIKERKIKAIIKEYCPDKSKFYSHDGTVCFNTKQICNIPSELTPTEANLCGTAFDYIARFLVARKMKDDKETVLNSICAGNVFGIAYQYFYKINYAVELLKYRGIFTTDKEDSICGSVTSYVQGKFQIDRKDATDLMEKGYIDVSSLSGDEVKELKGQYKEFLQSIRDFVCEKNDDEEDLIEKSIILAQLEQIRRSGMGYMRLDEFLEYNKKYDTVKEELEKLLKSFKNVFLPVVKENSDVIFNPRFGVGGRIVGGADADIYVDGTLYDFKVIKKNGWSSPYATQLMGYFLLDTIAKRCDDKDSDLYSRGIKRVAIYNIRYEKIYYYDCENINEDAIDEAIHRMTDEYFLYEVFRLKRHYEDIIEKYNIPINDDCCLDWNEQRAEFLKEYEKKVEDGISLSGYEAEECEQLKEIKNRISRFIETTDTLAIMRDVVNNSDD